MIEMRENENLKYSNAIPGWAKVFHKVILWLFYVITFAAFVLCFVCIYWQEWFGAIASFAGSGMFFWLCRLTRWSNKLYTDIELKCELQEDGYYTSIKNVLTGEEKEHLVSFAQMQEVVIARTTRYQSSGSNNLGFYIVGVKIIMKWTDEQGNEDYSLFGLDNAKNVEEWVQRFKQNGIAVFSSGANVSGVKVEDYKTGYNELPKIPYDEDTSSPSIGTIRYRDLKPWLSLEMKDRKQERELIRDKKVFKPLLLALLISNFLIALGWMPFWQMDDGMFSDESPSLIIGFSNFILLIVAGTYWRNKVKWYRCIRDVGFIVIAQIVGWMLLWMVKTVPDGMIDAIIIDGATLAFFNVIGFILFRLIRKLF